MRCASKSIACGTTWGGDGRASPPIGTFSHADIVQTRCAAAPAFFDYDFLVLGRSVAKGDVRAGETTEVPIPGLSVVAPVGSVGVVAAVQLGGNIDRVSLKLGIDACGEIIFLGRICASSYVLATWALDC